MIASHDETKGGPSHLPTQIQDKNRWKFQINSKNHFQITQMPTMDPTMHLQQTSDGLNPHATRLDKTLRALQARVKEQEVLLEEVRA